MKWQIISKMRRILTGFPHEIETETAFENHTDQVEEELGREPHAPLQLRKRDSIFDCATGNIVIRTTPPALETLIAV